MSIAIIKAFRFDLTQEILGDYKLIDIVSQEIFMPISLKIGYLATTHHEIDNSGD